MVSFRPSWILHLLACLLTIIATAMPFMLVTEYEFQHPTHPQIHSKGKVNFGVWYWLVEVDGASGTDRHFRNCDSEDDVNYFGEESSSCKSSCKAAQACSILAPLFTFTTAILFARANVGSQTKMRAIALGVLNFIFIIVCWATFASYKNDEKCEANTLWHKMPGSSTNLGASFGLYVVAFIFSGIATGLGFVAEPGRDEAQKIGTHTTLIACMPFFLWCGCCSENWRRQDEETGECDFLSYLATCMCPPLFVWFKPVDKKFEEGGNAANATATAVAVPAAAVAVPVTAQYNIQVPPGTEAGAQFQAALPDGRRVSVTNTAGAGKMQLISA